jgi:hypothetical protein
LVDISAELVVGVVELGGAVECLALELGGVVSSLLGGSALDELCRGDRLLAAD